MRAAEAQSGSPMKIVAQAFADLATHDADLVVQHTAAEAVEERPEGTFRGRDAIRALFAEMFRAVPDLEVDVERIAADGETVFVSWHLRGHFTGSRWQGVEPTGDYVELRGNDCVTVRDDLIVHNLVAYDTATFARQIGMLPTAGSASERLMTAMFNARVRLRRLLRRRRQSVGDAAIAEAAR